MCKSRINDKDNVKTHEIGNSFYILLQHHLKYAQIFNFNKPLYKQSR